MAATMTEKPEQISERITKLENTLNTTKECFLEIKHNNLLHISLEPLFFRFQTPNVFEKEFEELTESLDKVKREASNLLESVWNIVVLGKNKTGKTTLINSLLGKRNFLPTSATTQAFKGVVEISVSETNSLDNDKLQTYENDVFTEISEASLYSLFREETHSVRIALPSQQHEFLSSDVKLWDTPGLDRAENPFEDEQCSKMVESVCRKSYSVAVILFDVGLSDFKDSVMENINFALKCGIPQERILVGVTKWDSVPDEEKSETEEDIREELEEFRKMLFFIDATNTKQCEGFSAIKQQLKKLTHSSIQAKTEALKHDLIALENRIESKNSFVADILKSLLYKYTTRKQLKERIKYMLRCGLDEWKELIREEMKAIHTQLIDNVLYGYKLPPVCNNLPPIRGVTGDEMNFTVTNEEMQREQHVVRRRNQARIEREQYDVSTSILGNENEGNAEGNELLLEDGLKTSDPILKSLSSNHDLYFAEHIKQRRWLCTTPQEIKELVLKEYGIIVPREDLYLSQHRAPDVSVYKYSEVLDICTYLGNPNVIRVSAVVSSLSAGLKIISSELSRKVWVFAGACTALVGLGGYFMGETVATHFVNKKNSKKLEALKDFLQCKVENVLETTSVAGAETFMVGLLNECVEENQEKSKQIQELCKKCYVRVALV